MQQRRKVALASSLKTVLTGSLRALEFAIVIGAGVLAYVVRHEGTPSSDYVMTMVIGAGLAIYFMELARLYDFPLLSDVTAQAGPLSVAWLSLAVTLMALAFFIKVSEDFSRIWGGLWMIFSFTGLIVARVWIASLIKHWQETGVLTTQIAIVGAGPFGRDVARQLQQAEDVAIRVLDVFRAPDEPGGGPSFDDLVTRVRANEVDQVLLALPTEESAVAERILSRLKELPVAVKLCPGPAVLRVPTANVSRVGGIPLLDVYDLPVRGWNRVLKTIEDRIGGVVLAVLTLPLMMIIALGVKLTSPGPVLFRQTRYGFNNNEIIVLKFRTMFHGAGQEDAVPQAMRRDPRVTPFGRFLRRTSLDELPQLWNVIKGEMSLVGPRPHAVPHNQYYAQVIGDYLGRHKMKPGITGWAQIHGFRGETTSPDAMKKRVEHDLYYIENWSILLDLKILLLTPFVGLVHRNAY